jgi:hypothetical protein
VAAPSGATKTASPPFKKVVVSCGPHDYDAFLDDNYIGSFRTPFQAQAELDRVAYEAARRTPGALLHMSEPPESDHADDPRAPFGAPGGPHPDIAVTDDALDRAFEVLIRFYERSPAIVSRAERALEIAKDRTRFTIRADGSVTVQGSRRYQVTDDRCSCKDFFVRDGLHAGMCKHVIARELWRLAQATHLASGEPPAESLAPWAFCTLSSVALNRALKQTLKRAADASAVTFRITNRILNLNVRGAPIAELAGDDGCGARALTISSDNFAALCADYTVALRPFGRESILTRVLIDHDSATVALLADGFACEATGSLD